MEGDEGGSSGALTGGGVIPSLAFPGVPQLRGSKARQDRRGGHATERRHPSELLHLLGSPSPPTVGAGSPFLQERFGAERRQKRYLLEEPQFIKKMMHFETIILKDACLIF